MIINKVNLTKIRIGKNILAKNNNSKKYVKNNEHCIKGSNCSLNGAIYEKKVYKICKKLRISKQGIIRKAKFCKINEKELGGSSAEHDLVCNFHGIPIHIEIKKSATPDWMQLSIVKTDNIWHSKGNSKIPNESVKVFNELIKDYSLFGGKIPPFMNRRITHEQWVTIKKRQPHFRDTYINCPNDIISKLYKAKGTHYIQISDYGLYHTGEDPCNFGVPFFECEQELRVRTKIHSRNLPGFLKASVIVSAKPINITNLEKSKISLDTLENLPTNLSIF
jgi:hypothetical protein